MRDFITTALYLVAGASITVGAALIYTPAAWITAGVLAIVGLVAAELQAEAPVETSEAVE